MKENKLYWKYALILVVMTLGVVLLFKMIPYLSGILGAFTIYVLLRKQLIYLTEKKRMRRTLAAILLLGETILLFLIPLSLLVWMLLNKVDGISIDQAAIISSTEHITDLIHQKTGYNVLSENNLSAIVNFLTQVGQALVSGVGSFIMNLFILIFVLFFMLSSGNKMEKYVYGLLPFSDKNKTYVLKEIYNIVKANALGIPLLAFIQGGIAMAGYFIFGVPNAFFWGVITCFTTIIPIIYLLRFAG
jgi:predicted PurR-regulated permease PerM